MENTKQGTNLDFGMLISEKYSDLTKSEKRIANFLRKNQEEAAFLSAGEIANRLNLSEATLVRFARTLNFSSYPAMRSVLQDNFRRRVTHSSRIRGRLDDLREAGDIFDKMAVTEIDYLAQAIDSLDREAMNAAVELFENHKRIFVFGLGPSISLVDLIDIRLKRFGKDVIPLTNSGREVIESILSLTKDDLLFVICFFDLNPTLNLVLEYAQEVGCPTVILTDTLDTVLTGKADVTLAARRGPVGEFHSLVVPMTVINALLLAVAGTDQEHVMTTLDKLDNLRTRLKELNFEENK